MAAGAIYVRFVNVIVPVVTVFTRPDPSVMTSWCHIGPDKVAVSACFSRMETAPMAAFVMEMSSAVVFVRTG